MSDEKRRERVYLLIGRLEVVKHSIFWLLRIKPPPPHYEPMLVSLEAQTTAIRSKARDLREIAEALDELANELEKA